LQVHRALRDHSGDRKPGHQCHRGNFFVNTSSGANRYRVGADITTGGTLTYDGAIAYGSVGGLVKGRDLELTAVQSNTTTVINGLDLLGRRLPVA